MRLMSATNSAVFNTAVRTRVLVSVRVLSVGLVCVHSLVDWRLSHGKVRASLPDFHELTIQILRTTTYVLTPCYCTVL